MLRRVFDLTRTLRRFVFLGRQQELPQLPQHLASFTGRRLRHPFSL